MTLFNRIHAALAILTNSTTVTTTDKELLEWLGIDIKGKNVNEVTYFTCLKMLSETLGKMPLKYYQYQNGGGKIRAEPDDMTALLCTRPNPTMTPTTFWSAVELNCQHHGNAYVWIQRHIQLARIGGTMVNDGLWLLPTANVSVIMDDAGVFEDKGKLYYRYSDRTGAQYVFPQEDVLHFKNSYTFDGLMGVPVAEMIGDVVAGALKSQQLIGSLYNNGLTGPLALEFSNELDTLRRKKLQARYKEYLEGARTSGQIIPVPDGLKLSPLKMSLTESQFYEIKKYTALQIAAAFGIKPDQINNYDKSSYSSSEAQQLAFLVDTMIYRIKSYEEEINYKCLSDAQLKAGFWYRFNEKAVLRTDSKTQMDILTAAVNNGIYTPNEARDLLMLPASEGGDVLIVNGNYIPITKVGTQYGTSAANGQ